MSVPIDGWLGVRRGCNSSISKIGIEHLHDKNKSCESSLSAVNIKERGEAIMRIKLGLAVVAALALSAAVAASAYATGFLATKAETLLAENVSPQLFLTDSGVIECKKVNILAGTSSTNETTAQLALVAYEDCKAFSIFVVEISVADYDFLASGAVHINKLIKIKVPGTGCEISVPAQTVNSTDYQTNGRNILIEPLVKSIKYTQNANCTGGAGALANGSYHGHLEVMIPNGTVSFMP